MAKMASWGEINAKLGSTIGSPANRCPTKAMIEATGKATVTASYASNQLVPISAVSAKVMLPTNIITIGASMQISSGRVSVSAYAEKPVTSALTIGGNVIVEPSSKGYDFAISFLSGYQYGSTTVNVNVLEESVSMGYAYVNPTQDSAYRYEVIY